MIILIPDHCLSIYFNGHNILWGSKDISDKGRTTEHFIDNHGLCLYKLLLEDTVQKADDG